MSKEPAIEFMRKVTALPDGQPVLIAGPTASGKSALALRVAEEIGGRIINADAIQVFSNWRILTARPDEMDEQRAEHRLYGHVPGDMPYSVGQWLREIGPLLNDGKRPIVVGGTGLYFTALTEGLAEIPPTPEEIRNGANTLMETHGHVWMAEQLDAKTQDRIDLNNPVRVQRAWEVLRATGRGLASWQDDTPPPLLPLQRTCAVVMDAPKEWLTPRIEKRFDAMLDAGALEEARANLADWSPDHPSSKAIGASELIAVLQGSLTLDQA
ncbi:unnamed protein product, partial [Cyprideis torosa]